MCIGRHMWPPGQKNSVQSLFSQNCPELGIQRGKKMHRNEFISVWKFSGNEGKFCGKKLKHGNEFISVRKFCGNEGNWGKICGKKLGMEMSLFLCGNEINWGKLCGEKTEAWKWVYLCTEFCGNEVNWGKIMYSNIYIYVSLIGNGTWKNGRQQMAANNILEISGGIIFHGLDYLI